MGLVFFGNVPRSIIAFDSVLDTLVFYQVYYEHERVILVFPGHKGFDNILELLDLESLFELSESTSLARPG